MRHLSSIFASLAMTLTLGAQEPSMFEDITANRPLLSLFWYPGFPAIYAEGQRTPRADLDRILGSFDSVISEDMGLLQKLPKPGDDLTAYETQVSKLLGGGMTGYERLVHFHGAVPTGRRNGGAVPNWYLASDDAWERNAKGERLMPCLTNPDLYSQVFDRFYQEMGKVDKGGRVAGWFLESEPSLSGLGLSVNPHTKAAFTAFLSEHAGGDIASFNARSGLQAASYAEVPLDSPNWLVNIYRSRFSKYVLADYQRRVVEAMRAGGCTPVITRWCETMGGGGSNDPRDGTYLADVPSNIAGFTWYAGNPHIPHTAGNRAHLGRATADWSMLSAFGKPLALVEFNAWRSHVSTWEGGPASTPITPLELRHHVYRGLYYNVRAFSLFSWQQPMTDFSWLNIWSSPDLMDGVASLRAELKRMAPFSTFGKRLPAPAAIILSRDAQGLPVTDDPRQRYGGNNHYYGDLQHRLGALFEDPALACFDVLEVHAGLTAERLRGYRALVAVDACLPAELRQTLADIAAPERPVFVIGAPRLVDEHYFPVDLPDAYPVSAVEPTGLKTPTTVQWLGQSVPLVGATHVTPRDGAEMLATEGDRPVAVKQGSITWFGGLPRDNDALAAMLRDVLANAQVHHPPLYVSPFERALVLQNYRTDCLRVDVDGRIERPFPWHGKVTLPWSPDPGMQLCETRSGMPWLAWRDDNGQRLALGVRLDSGDIKVLTPRPGEVQPHLEALTGPIGFDRFALGAKVWRGWFTAGDSGDVTTHLSPGKWSAIAKWTVIALPAGEVVSTGNGVEAAFAVEAGKDYYLQYTRQPEE